MDREKRIMDEVNKTMELMDHQKILGENPFFYTRLKARMSEISIKPVSRSYKFLVAASPVGLLLLLLINIFTALYVVRSDNSSSAAVDNSKVKNEITSGYRFDQNCYIYNIKIRK